MASQCSLLLAFLLLGILAPLPTSAWDNDTLSPIYPNKPTTFLRIRDDTYGVRNVSYWVTDDGQAVIDGDVIYGTLEDLLAHNYTGQVSTNNTRRAFSIFRSQNPWPDATLIYNYDSTATENLLSPIVNNAIAKWKAVAPYLTFTKVANSATGKNGVLTIHVNGCNGCNSVIGFSNSPMNMNLQQQCPSGSCGVTSATHEFGHALGLHHEHQRPDRERFVHYHCENLNPTCNNMPVGKTCCSSGIPAGCCTLASNFAVLSGTTHDASGPYDIKSIMEYPASAFAIFGTDTLTPAAPGIVVPDSPPDAITTIDANRICKIYAGRCPKAQACIAAGCPSKCAVVFQCNKPDLCGLRPTPPCCHPVSAGMCQSRREACTRKGCDFLKN